MSGSGRPLIITDCDEVLLHMLVPFREWLNDLHQLDLIIGHEDFSEAIRRKDSGDPVEREHVWELLRGFFATEMHRQTPIAGALDALARLSEIADIEVLTNITEEDHARREAQLRQWGVSHKVHWNQGGKGRPLARIVAERQPGVSVFIDDLAQHHASVAKHAPATWRLHMMGEPEVAPHISPAPDAHARIRSEEHTSELQSH